MVPQPRRLARSRRSGGHARNSLARCDVARDDGAGADERTLTDPSAAQDNRAGPERRTMLDNGTHEQPVVLGLQRAQLARRTRELIVDEQDAMADENLVLDRDPCADERMALDLAPRTDHGIALDLHERPDARLVANAASVEVRERRDDDVLAEIDVVNQPIRRTVYGFIAQEL